MAAVIFYIVVIVAIVVSSAYDSRMLSGKRRKDSESDAPLLQQTPQRTVVQQPKSVGTQMHSPQVSKNAEAEEVVETPVMEYLEKKAQEQEKQQKLEEHKERMREMRMNKNSLTPGQRLPDWGEVPTGTKMVLCNYCATENVVPINGRGQYCCYFCKEKLPQ